MSRKMEKGLYDAILIMGVAYCGVLLIDVIKNAIEEHKAKKALKDLADEMKKITSKLEEEATDTSN